MERRVIELTHKHQIAHLGSNLTALPIIDYIFRTKSKNDIFILSSGHAGLALYSVLEHYDNNDAEALFNKHGVHPHRDKENGIWSSSGSLGSAVLVAVGYALADASRNVHVLLSDGECAEGSVWEALEFSRKHNLKNLKFHVNVNGYSAYDAVDRWNLFWRLKAFNRSVNVWFTENPETSFMKGLIAHYYILKQEDKDEMILNTNEKDFCVVPLRFYEQGFKDILAYGRSWFWSS